MTCKLVVILGRRRDIVVEEPARTDLDHCCTCLIDTLIEFWNSHTLLILILEGCKTTTINMLGFRWANQTTLVTASGLIIQRAVNWGYKSSDQLTLWAVFISCAGLLLLLLQKWSTGVIVVMVERLVVRSVWRRLLLHEGRIVLAVVGWLRAMD